MADTITAKAEPSTYTRIPEGPHQVVCVDVIDLGEVHDAKWNKISRKCALVFQSQETDPATKKRYEIAERFTISMHEKARLRKFLGQWRGKSYSDAEASAGVPLDKLEGANALINVEHRQVGEKTYANILSIGPLAKGMEKVKAEGYTRSPRWLEKKEQPKPVTKRSDDFEDFPTALEDEEDNLPF